MTVIVDQYQCVKTNSKYLWSIGDLKFSRKSIWLALILCHTYMLLLYISVCTYLHLFTNQALSKSIACYLLRMALSVSCTCCALVSASAGCCGYLCYPSAVMRQWPLWSNPVPLSLIQCTHVVPLFLGCCVIRHMVLIALKCEKVLRLPLRSYRLYNRISQLRFDTPTQSVSWSPVVLSLNKGLQSSPLSR